MKKKMLLTAAAILLAAGTDCAAEFDFVNNGSIKNSNLKKISSPVPAAMAVGRTETPRAAAKKMRDINFFSICFISAFMSNSICTSCKNLVPLRRCSIVERGTKTISSIIGFFPEAFLRQ